MTSRDQFEQAYAEDNGMTLLQVVEQRMASGSYRVPAMSRAWFWWQESRAAVVSTAPETCEATPAMERPQTKGALDAARRVSACLAACAGTSTPVLEKGRLSPEAFHVRETRADKSEQQRDDLLADLREAAATLRRYETLHRAKATDESTAKAEVNAALASRFEATIRKATE